MYIVDQVVAKLSNSFFLQLDESTDENDLSWKFCCSICPDAEDSMTGRTRGLITRIKEENPDVKWIHYVLQGRAAAPYRSVLTLLRKNTHPVSGCEQSSNQVNHAGTFDQFDSRFPFLLSDLEKKSAQLDWVGEPFLLSEEKGSKLPVTIQEELLVVSSNCGLQLKLAKSILTQFWEYDKQEYPDMGQKALKQLLLFPQHIYVRPPLCNDCEKDKTEKQTEPGEEQDYSSCLPATKTKQEQQAQVSH
nr:uncharacterized protein LOC121116582 [Lepeophtheirus salmonis]